MPTKIEWCEETKNPVKVKGPDGKPQGYHCTKISEGCVHCYGEPINRRFGNRIPYDDRDIKFVLDRKVFEQIGTWRKKPRRCFVQSMSDLFHKQIPDGLIGEVLSTLNIFKRHTFIFLTKRPERMKEMTAKAFPDGPPAHFWLGVTAENQARADERIPVLLSIPAAVHFVSIEPCLGPVDLSRWISPVGTGAPFTSIMTGDKITFSHALKWVILGCETGPGRRTMQPVWARDVKDQCVAAGVPFFLKQMYRNDGTLWKLPQLDGQIWNQYPNNERTPNA